MSAANAGEIAANTPQCTASGVAAVSPQAPVSAQLSTGQRSWPRWLAAWLALLPIALLRAVQLAESDTFWQVRTGLLIIDSGRIPDTDPFSWTAAGRAWVLNSWGFDVLVGAAYRLGGLPGVALTGSALVMLAFAAALLLASRLGATPGVAALLLLLVSPFAVGWLSVRPQVFDYVAVPVLLVLVDLVFDAAKSIRVRVAAVVGAGLLHAVWVNLHAAAPLGVVICAALALTYLLRERLTRRAARRSTLAWGSGLVLAVFGGVLLNPYGFGVLTQAHEVRAASGFVREWQSAAALAWNGWLVLAIGIAAAVVAWVRRDAPRLVAIALLLTATGFAIRFLPILMFVALPVIASARAVPGVSWVAERYRLLFRPVLALSIVCFGLVAAFRVPYVGSTELPTMAIRSLPSGCRLFNSYPVGGPVILLRPDVLVSLDSRSDLYGEPEVVRLGAMSPDDLSESGVTCMIVKRQSKLAARLYEDPMWRVVLTDHDYVLIVPAAGHA